jgi:hypothetical protein
LTEVILFFETARVLFSSYSSLFEWPFYFIDHCVTGAIVKYKHGIKSDEAWRNPTILPYYADAQAEPGKRRVAYLPFIFIFIFLRILNYLFFSPLSPYLGEL